jgi:DNA-binding transcriptional MerR regulator
VTERTYSSREVCEETGVTYRQLDYWIRVGYISGVGCPGSGRQRRYTASDVERVKEIRRAMAKAIQTLRDADLNGLVRLLEGGLR